MRQISRDKYHMFLNVPGNKYIPLNVRFVLFALCAAFAAGLFPVLQNCLQC